jgi:hypothetical protein
MTNVNWNPETSASQAAQIGAYLMQGNKITPLEALNLFGSLRLSAVIFTLRERGYKIQVERVKTNTGKWVAQYWINPEDRV